MKYPGKICFIELNSKIFPAFTFALSGNGSPYFVKVLSKRHDSIGRNSLRLDKVVSRIKVAHIDPK